MKAFQIINDIMNKYYNSKEIIDSYNRDKILEKEISINEFNDAINDLNFVLDNDTTSNVILTGFLLNYFNENNKESLKALISLNFHKNHEDIAGLFQRNYYNDVDNIPVLLSVLNTIPDYLSSDDFKYPYIRKIIYAIGAQPEPYNIEALEKLANETGDEQIKELALHQVKKRKELGRWEATKNT
jgi:hypothetical protein